LSIEHLNEVLATPGLPVCVNPIFIIGSPRSGTTALARALGVHPELWTSHESYIIHSFFGDDRANRTWKGNVEREQAPSWLKTEQVMREEFLGFLGLGINALFTSRSGGRRWIDQTPLYTTMVDDLALLFPGAKFLHILRDGRRVVHSMINFLNKMKGRPRARQYVPSWSSDFEQACRTWRETSETAVRFCTEHPDRALTVINEQVSGDPVSGFAIIYEFLDVAWAPTPIEHFSGKRVNSSFGPSDQAPAQESATWPDWDDERRGTFLAEAGETMVRLGLATAEELDAWARPSVAPR
jgi:hypothetical protein